MRHIANSYKGTAIANYALRITHYALTVALLLFFSIGYQNHFYLQEQNQLFVLSADWLSTYFAKPAWAACVIGDYLTQFYYLTAAGPAILTVCIAITSWLSLVAVRRFANKWIAHIVAIIVLLLLAFSMMDGYSRLASVIAIMGGLACYIVYTPQSKIFSYVIPIVGLCLSYWMFGVGCIVSTLLIIIECIVKRRRILPSIVSIIVLLALTLATQYKYNLHYIDNITYPGISTPKMPETDYETTLDVENAYYFGNYDGVIKKVKAIDNPNKLETFYYYLVYAEKGQLADKLLTLKNIELGTLTTISDKSTLLTINVMSDLYYAIGDMMYTERAAMLANSFSPQNRNARYIKRLAEANIVSGDSLAANKYLRLLSHTMFYKKWAEDRLSKPLMAKYKEKREMQNTQDTLRIGDNCRTILLELLDSNPENNIALDYLLCTDLIVKDIENFKADYDKYCIATASPRIKPIYQQALMIWLAGTNAPEEQWQRYIADASQLQRFKEYNANRGSSLFSDTYWYYFDKL